METPPTLKELYDMLREQIQHEDSLVNHRLTWLLALEGFLLAGAAALLTAQSVQEPAKTIFVVIISVFGIAFSISGLFGISAAHQSLKILIEKWEKEPVGSPAEVAAWISARAQYPPITFVGKGLANAWSAAEGTPRIIMAAWVIIIIFALFFA